MSPRSEVISRTSCGPTFYIHKDVPELWKKIQRWVIPRLRGWVSEQWVVGRLASAKQLSQGRDYFCELCGALKPSYNLKTFPTFSCHSGMPANFHKRKAAQHLQLRYSPVFVWAILWCMFWIYMFYISNLIKSHPRNAKGPNSCQRAFKNMISL